MSKEPANISIGRQVAYYPNIAKALKSSSTAVFLCQFLYWKDRVKDPDGWVYKTYAEIREETGLSEREVDNARKQLKGMGILTEKRKGIPPVIYYQFNWEVFDDILKKYTVSCIKSTPCPDNKVQDVPIKKYEVSQLKSTGCTEREVQGVLRNTETTTETTSETTTKKSKSYRGVKTPSVYSICVQHYFEFYDKTLKMGRADFKAVDGKKLKSIIAYLEKNVPPDQTVDEALKQIFSNWKSLPKFLQDQIRLAQIDQFLPNIIKSLKGGNSKTALDEYAADLMQGRR